MESIIVMNMGRNKNKISSYQLMEADWYKKHIPKHAFIC